MSPVETWCHNINYYIPDEEGVTKDFSAENMTRIREFSQHFNFHILNVCSNDNNDHFTQRLL